NPNNTTSNATFTHLTGTGPIVVRWTISNPPCTASTADVTITINQPPNTGLTVSPASTTICSGPTVNVTITSAENGVTYQFVNVGLGANSGSSANGTGANLTLTSAALTASTTLQVKATRSPCSTVTLTNSTAVTVNQPPTTATVGGPQTICALGTTAGLGGNTPSVGTGAWSVVSGGTGSFNPNNTTPNATFTHTSGAGPIVLRWTISNAPCTASTADVTITINQNPTTA